VQSTKQVTSAMKMVSAAKLRKAQDAILRMRPYATKLHEVLSRVVSNMDSAIETPYAVHRPVGKVLLVLVTSNRGLCGAFNANVVKQAASLLEGEYAQAHAQGLVDFMIVGKKAADQLKARKLKAKTSHNELWSHLNFAEASKVAEEVMAAFATGQYDKVELIYNQFKNAGTQILVHEPFLPIVLEKRAGSSKGRRNDYIFDPDMDSIVRDLVPKALKIQFFKALLDSQAAEHGARMTAMHKATDNATSMIRELKLKYNKARQAAITTELTEIVAGAQALG